jgi:cyclophilin family peptidyl-prolyl cis-trans isomerase/uncharacterized SAM-binding protein YcdF (DUF218 family)
MPLDAIVVLGCRVGPARTLSGAAERRVRRAADAFFTEGMPWLIACGGERWHGLTEARAFEARLIELGVPSARIVKELSSHSTRQNARFASRILRERGLARVGVVTCHWHMARALSAFRHYGVEALALPAEAPSSARRVRRFSEPLQRIFDKVWLSLERVGLLTLVCLFALSSACRNETERTGSALVVSSSAPSAHANAGMTLRSILASQRARELDGGASEAATASDPTLREAALRTFARGNADRSAQQTLLDGLADEAPRVIGLAAFGLGRSCSGRENEFSRALSLRAARLVSRLDTEPPARGAGHVTAGASVENDAALAAIANALGHCASEESERSLAAWLKLGAAPAEAAALALGEVGQRRGRLEEQTIVLLLAAANPGESQVKNALAPFSRFILPAGALRERLITVAEGALARPGGARNFALRALGRVGAVDALLREAEASSLEPLTASELARELARAGEAGQRGLTELLLRTVPSENAALADFIAGGDVGALLVILDGLAAPSAKGRDTLVRLTQVDVGNGNPATRRRATLVRCGAARLLTQNPDDPELLRCDLESSGRSGKLARLFVLDQGKIGGARRTRFVALTNDPDAVVRQSALRLLAKHREVTDTAPLLVQALGSDSPGVVAAAAEILSAHPERAAAASEPRRAEGDKPVARKPDTRLSAALTHAFATVSPNNVAVRVALIDAAMSLNLLGLMSELEKSCADANSAVRSHSERALRALGQPNRRCLEAANIGSEPEELARLVTRQVTLVFSTDAGELQLALDPSSAPLAVTRVVDLARSGFYDGTVVHRALFGFAVQFGDPAGDGYGVAPRPPLFSELAPTPFEEGAVGLAASGLDSGSSQIFVTLGRFPHLDGESARIGHAGSGWERLVVGDRIQHVTVRE